MRFGVSTHLYHDRRLERDHLAQVAAYGFEAIELFATRSHFDYRDEAAIDFLKQWLAETGLTLNSVHAPITDLFGSGDRWSPTYSNAVNDREQREAAVRETDRALKLAERIPFDVLVVHLGSPTSREVAGDNHRASAVRSLEEICNLAGARGVPAGQIYASLEKSKRLGELERAITEEKVFDFLLKQSTVEEVKS